MIVTLSNTVSVNPLQVASILVDDGKNRLILRMVDGETHSLPCQYGKSIFATRDDLVAQMNLPYVRQMTVQDSPELREWLDAHR